MRPDPWADIGFSADSLTVRRVDPTHPADFYWGRDAEGRRALVLTTAASVSVKDPRPVLNGIEIIEAPQHDGKNAFILVLRREEDADLFRHLCDDIVEACRGRAGDQAYLAATIQRAWKWHSLLRGGGNRRLGPEEQRGLIGELLFLEWLTGRLAPKASIEAWRGPLDEPKDFVFNGHAVEVKARHIGKNSVKVSSEHQLQIVQGQELSLAVFALSPASDETPDSFTLDSLVSRLGEAITVGDPSAEDAFESRLLSAGYSREDNYADAWWVNASVVVYAVKNEFPRIQASDLSYGIAAVTYWLELDRCAPFESTLQNIILARKS
jgi:hypothetical protein